VSHRLPELFAIADEVTVLRDGRSVSSGAIGEYDAARLVHDMVGEVQDVAHERREQQGGDRPVRLSVSDLSDGRMLSSVSLEVGAGEIVGVAGLAGSGRTALLETIFGARPATGGTVVVDGRSLQRHDPSAAIAAGMGLVPAERKVDGVVLSMSVADNLTMAQTSNCSWWRPPRRSRSPQLTRMLADLRIKTASPGAPVSTLSGGNQQKVVIGKWLAMKPRVLLLDEPTRGIDVGAKVEIQNLVGELADNGLSVVFISAELEEVVRVAHRVIVLRDGRIVDTLPSESLTVDSLLALVARPEELDE
jgi:simple sugar transport system ATP-binding protein